MIIFSYNTIKSFADEYPRKALNNWYIIFTKADLANFNAVREIFGSVDAVRNDLYVFNIKGNHYRLIVRIHFNVRTVYIKFIGTHKQYENLDLNLL